MESEPDKSVRGENNATDSLSPEVEGNSALDAIISEMFTNNAAEYTGGGQNLSQGIGDTLLNAGQVDDGGVIVNQEEMAFTEKTQEEESAGTESNMAEEEPNPEELSTISNQTGTEDVEQNDETIQTAGLEDSSEEGQSKGHHGDDLENHDDWSEAIVKMCKQIESCGDECTILYLKRGQGKKNFLHRLGTSKGKEFLKENAPIAKLFLSFCFGSSIKSVLSKEDVEKVRQEKKRALEDEDFSGKDNIPLHKKIKIEDVSEDEDDQIDDKVSDGEDDMNDDVSNESEDEEENRQIPTTKRKGRRHKEKNDENEVSVSAQSTPRTRGKKSVVDKTRRLPVKRQFKCSECDYIAAHPWSLRKHKLESHQGTRKASSTPQSTRSRSPGSSQSTWSKSPGSSQSTRSKSPGSSQSTRSRSPASAVKSSIKETRGNKALPETPNTLGISRMNDDTGEKEYLCRDCDFVTSHPMTLRRHIRENHQEAWERWCNPTPKKGKKSAEKEEKKERRKRDEGASEKDEAPDEGVRGKRRSAMLFKEKMSQVKQLELEKKKYSCKLCSKMFIQKPAITKHVLKCHPRINPNKVILSQEAGKEQDGNRRGPYKKKKDDDDEWSPKKGKKIKVEKDDKANKVVVNKDDKDKDDDNSDDEQIVEKEGGSGKLNYPCSHCNKKFKAASILRRHTLTEHPKSRVKKYASAITSKYKTLSKQPKILKTGKRAGQISKKAADFKYSRRTLRTMKTDEMQEDIPDESEDENNDTGDEDAKEEEDGTENQKKCLQCSEVFPTFRKWLRHVRSSEHEDITEENTIYFCFDCDKHFTCVEGLKNHMKMSRHTGNPAKKNRVREVVSVRNISSVSKRRTQYRCNLCGTEYIKEENCQAHVEQATCSPKFAQTCPICEELFYTKNLFEAHLQEKKHVVKKTVEKEQGDKEDSSVRLVIAGDNAEAPEDTVQQTTCLECKKEFTNPEFFRAHMEATRHEQVSLTETLYKCYTCMKFYVSEESLTSHMLHTRHTGNVGKDKERKYVHVKCLTPGSKRQMWFRCTCCCAEFKLEDNARAHVEKADCVPKFKRKCQICNTHFINNNKYQLHMKRGLHYRRDPKLRDTEPRVDNEVPSETETIYQCFTCDKFYRDFNSLRRHMDATKHTGDPEKDCKRDVEEFRDSTGLTRYRCSLCKIEFCLEVNCREHVEKAMCRTKYKRKCPLCNLQVYTGVNVYYVHMHEKHGDEFPFKCEDCPKVFHHLAAYNCHRNQHRRGPYVPNYVNRPDVITYQCDICGNVYTDKGNLKRHQNCHNEARNFTCEICGKSYRRKDFLKFHMKYNHGGGNNPDDPGCVCDICGKVLATPKSKYAHMKRAHSDDKPYCCEICGYRSKQLGNLKFHHAMHHSDAKPFQCDYKGCGKRFQTQQLWKKHMANHCLKQGLVEDAAKWTKTYICKDCGKAFISKSNFESHCLKHYGREMQCSLCDTKMRRRSSLRRHYKRVHRMDLQRVDEMVKDMPQDKDLLELHKKKGHVNVKEEMIEREEGVEIEGEHEVMETILIQTRPPEPPTLPDKVKSPQKTRDYHSEAQTQVSILTSEPSTSNNLVFDPSQVEFEEVSVPENIVELAQAITTETTGSASVVTETAAGDSQQIILDGPLADMLHEKVIRAVVNPDGSISIHIQE